MTRNAKEPLQNRWWGGKGCGRGSEEAGACIHEARSRATATQEQAAPYQAARRFEYGACVSVLDYPPPCYAVFSHSLFGLTMHRALTCRSSSIFALAPSQGREGGGGESVISTSFMAWRAHTSAPRAVAPRLQ